MGELGIIVALAALAIPLFAIYAVLLEIKSILKLKLNGLDKQ